MALFTVTFPTDIFLSHWRLLGSLLIGLIVGLSVTSIWSLSFSTSFIIGWDCAILVFMSTIIIMLRKDTMHEHLNSAKQSKLSVLSLIVVSSFICIYAIAKQTHMGKNYQDLMFALSISLTIGTIFITWLMIQIIFAMQYAYLYFSEAQKGHILPLEFPEAMMESNADSGTPVDVRFEDFFYCAVAIGTSGQTADIAFTSKTGRKLATLHSIIAFFFNLVIIALLINIIATYL